MKLSLVTILLHIMLLIGKVVLFEMVHHMSVSSPHISTIISSVFFLALLVNVAHHILHLSFRLVRLGSLKSGCCSAVRADTLLSLKLKV